MSIYADAFGMVSAAIQIAHAPWRIGTGRNDDTPLCLAWGHYMDAPRSIAAGAWLGGWERVEWGVVSGWPSLDSEMKRLEAYTLGVLARNVWEQASEKEHAPHRWKATPIREHYRCECGAWAWGVWDAGDKRPKFTRRGKKWWPKLDAKLKRYMNPAAPLDYTFQPRWQGKIRDAREPDRTPELDEVIR